MGNKRDRIRARLLSDNDSCYYCEKSFFCWLDVSIDHYLPITYGGKYNMDNLLASCERCNNKRGSMGPETYRILKELDCLPSRDQIFRIKNFNIKRSLFGNGYSIPKKMLQAKRADVSRRSDFESLPSQSKVRGPEKKDNVSHYHSVNRPGDFPTMLYLPIQVNEYENDTHCLW